MPHQPTLNQNSSPPPGRFATRLLICTFTGAWEVDGGTVIALFDVYYRRLDGGELTLPCCNVFRVQNGLVLSYLIYMDVNPVLAQ
ncbi:MAG: nuclear transport factor 2 family protein [Mycobacterium sp.]